MTEAGWTSRFTRPHRVIPSRNACCRSSPDHCDGRVRDGEIGARDVDRLVARGCADLRTPAVVRASPPDRYSRGRIGRRPRHSIIDGTTAGARRRHTCRSAPGEAHDEVAQRRARRLAATYARSYVRIFEVIDGAKTAEQRAREPQLLRRLLHAPDQLGRRAARIELSLQVPDCTGGTLPAVARGAPAT
jgi:hypothetical protein